MKKKKRIFAGAPSEQAQQTKKEVLSGKCLRTQHNKADRQTKLFKAADGIIAALKKRSALPVHANNPRAAFTLAEVLIALTIIGVVSALTIPTLVQKTNKQEYVSALQKAYSTLSQATNMIIAENGSPDKSTGGWADSPENVYNLYRKYLNSAKECGTAAGGCFQNSYKTFNGNIWNTVWDGNRDHRKLVLADGAQILFGTAVSSDCSSESSVCFSLIIDINGNKKPNQVGRDVFELKVLNNGLNPDCARESICTSTGWGCACKVLREGKMDY